jgi:hypothetical protein
MRRTRLLLSIEARGEDGEEQLRKLVARLHEALEEQAANERKDTNKPPARKP